MGIRYYNATQSRSRTQAKRKHTPHVKMSKEARALLNIRRRTVAIKFRKEIDDVHDYILKSTSAIAEKHGKSLRNVEFNIGSGRSGLTRQHPNKTSAWNAYVHDQSKGRSNGRFHLSIPSFVALDFFSSFFHKFREVKQCWGKWSKTLKMPFVIFRKLRKMT
jgi:hypothetical protein